MVQVSQLSNIAANAAAPVMDQGLVLGSVEYVLLEAAVSMLLRRVIKAARRPFLEEVVLHTISLPFLGGLGVPFGKAGNPREPYTRQFIDGTKGIPAVFLAQYVQATGQKGFHLPSLNVNDIVITAIAKTITRPITKTIFDFAPAVIREHIERVRILVGRQEVASLLAAWFSSATGAGGGASSYGAAGYTYRDAGREQEIVGQRAPYAELPGRAGGSVPPN